MIRLPIHLRPLLLPRCFPRRLFSTLPKNESANSSAPNDAYGYGKSSSRRPARTALRTASPRGGRADEKRTKARKKKTTTKKKQTSSSTEPAARLTQLQKEVYQKERYAALDIYNYAASQGFIPEILIAKSNVATKTGKRQARATVTIKLLEQGLEASATATDPRLAEVAAAIDFKRQAEQYQSKQDGKPDTPQGFEYLNTETVSEFFEFLGNVDRNTKYESRVVKATQFSDMHYGYVTANGERIGEQVLSRTKKEAEQLSRLIAAVYLARQNPQILEKFRIAMVKGHGKVIKEVTPGFLRLQQATLNVMHDAIQHTARSVPLPRVDVEDEESTFAEARSQRRLRSVMRSERFDQLSRNLSAQLDLYLADPKLEKLRAQKRSLPMNQYKDDVLKMINENQYSIVVGATGSGKTTQVPQLLLDEAIQSGMGAGCDIVCTQPRRIAAISVAERVSQERNQKVGESIGYHVRFDRRLAAPGGSVNFCTTGILLEQLKHDADGVFDSTSHLLIDEVHERDLNIDFLMIILKKAIKARKAAGKPVPKVVLMSATLDTELFAKYFNQSDEPGVIVPCPSTSVPGRTFPVQEKFLGTIMRELEKTYDNDVKRLLRDRKCQEYLDSERAIKGYDTLESSGGESEPSVIDWKRQPVFGGDGDTKVQTAAEEALEALVPVPLVAATLAHICNTSNEGAILVFLPGLAEILDTQEALTKNGPVLGVDFGDTRRFKISTLHSTTTKESQAEVFQPVQPGCRKIILSTNIAETSVTIPDVQYVVDSGKHREKRYDQLRRITKLQCSWISKSNSKQRAGRAGRVQNGNYYALFARGRFEMLRTISLPELLRSDLSETCLATKIQCQDDSIGQFLAQAIEPPAPNAVESAVDVLKSLEALTDEEELTPLGRLLSKLPVHPTLGKMIVFGVIFKCLDPLLILGAAAAERSLMVEPIDRREEARKAHRVFNAGHQSDHITLLNAFNTVRRVRDDQGPDAAWRFGMDRYLHMGAFKNIDGTANQIVQILVEVGLIPNNKFSSGQQNSRYGPLEFNENADNLALVKCLVLAGCHPNIAIQNNAHSPLFSTSKDNKAMISRQSVNQSTILQAIKASKESKESKESRDNNKNSEFQVRRADVPDRTLLTFNTLSASQDSLAMRETTVVTPLMCAMFGGKVKKISDPDPRMDNKIVIDDWLPFYVRTGNRHGPQAAEAVIEFKAALDRTVSHAFQSLSSLDRGGSFRGNYSRDVFVRSLVQALNLEELGGGYATASENVLSRRPGSENAFRKPAWSVSVTRAQKIPPPIQRNEPYRAFQPRMLQGQKDELRKFIKPQEPIQFGMEYQGRLESVTGRQKKPAKARPAVSLFGSGTTQSDFARRYPHLFS